MVATGGEPFYFQNGTFTDIAVFQEKVLQEADVIIDLSGTITTYDEFLAGYGVNASQTETYPFLQNQAVYRLDGRVNTGGSTGTRGLAVWGGVLGWGAFSVCCSIPLESQC